MRKIEVYSENRSDEGLLEDVRKQVKADNDLELVTEDGDILVVLGDRPAVLKKALEYVEEHKPVAHISGGEKTVGCVDDYTRHAITKMSHIHFTSTDEYRNRVLQLGEIDDMVHYVGEPGLDDLKTEDNVFLEEHFLITYHPTFDDSNIDDLFLALKNVNRKLIFTAPQKDKGYKFVVSKIKAFVKENPQSEYVESMGRKKYLSYLKWARAVIGNSSSGIVEAPSYGTPCINIGDRQKGRTQGFNVINCKLDKEEIMEAIMKAKRIETTSNPYRKDGNAIKNIIHILKTVDMEDIMIKEFRDR